MIVPRTLTAAALAAAAPLLIPAAAAQDCTGPASPVKLYVDVSGIRSATGLIAVTLYADDSKRFLAKRGSLYVGRVPAKAPNTRVCIHLPSTGVYAFAVYHDEDANRKINRNAIGLPREGFGFSNNPPTFFSIPSFSRVRVSVPRSGASIGVKLRYP